MEKMIEQMKQAGYSQCSIDNFEYICSELEGEDLQDYIDYELKVLNAPETLFNELKANC